MTGWALEFKEEDRVIQEKCKEEGFIGMIEGGPKVNKDGIFQDWGKGNRIASYQKLCV